MVCVSSCCRDGSRTWLNFCFAIRPSAGRLPLKAANKHAPSVQSLIVLSGTLHTPTAFSNLIGFPNFLFLQGMEKNGLFLDTSSGVQNTQQKTRNNRNLGYFRRKQTCCGQNGPRTIARNAAKPWNSALQKTSVAHPRKQSKLAFFLDVSKLWHCENVCMCRVRIPVLAMFT